MEYIYMCVCLCVYIYIYIGVPNNVYMFWSMAISKKKIMIQLNETLITPG